jgi:hypothetical protein
MKYLPCAGPGCASRRLHYEKPDTPRGSQWVEVPDEYEGNAFCSIECWSYFKESVKHGTQTKAN